MKDKGSLLELATIRINCNGETGTALLYFPGSDLEYVYVFTAKHCLSGSRFDKEYSYKDITLDKIFNSISKKYHSLSLTETDRILVSDNSKDIAILILPKFKILELTGRDFSYHIIDSSKDIKEYEIRGFASMNDQKEDRSFPMVFQEDIKSDSNQFLLKSNENLDTFYQQAALNMKGISGAGAFAKVLNEYYLVGIVHSYKEGNLFHATKINCINQLLVSSKLEPLESIAPEKNVEVRDAFFQIEKNEVLLKTRINDRIGSLNIRRDTVGIDELLLNSGMAVIFGKPGVGKSSIAKSLINKLKKQDNITIIPFSSEQIDSDSLNDSFSKAGYKTDIETILISPIGHARTIIWVESFEKVIESNRLNAFREILLARKQRPNVQILITMRDYSLQRFRINLRFELPDNNIYFPVKGFDDSEMEEVKSTFPEIGPLLENHKIQKLLRVPFYLDKAIRILPELLKEDQLDEVSFKKLMWENIVEREDVARGNVFLSICLKRAKEMSLFTTYTTSRKVIDELLKDNILQSSQEEVPRYTPSHDILEDWALTRHIQQKWLSASDPKVFISSLENSPALTRAFRLWLEAFYRNEPKASISMANSILLDPDIDENWKDVVYIASLKSSNAHIFLGSLSKELLENQAEFLMKIILLLETGCMIQDYGSKNLSEFFPVGSGWDYVIKFIKDNLQILLTFPRFVNNYRSFLLLWGKQLSDFNTSELTVSAVEAGELIEDYLYRNQKNFREENFRKSEDSELKPLLAVFFQLTAAIPDQVKELVDASININHPHLKWKEKGLLKNVRNYLIGGVLSDQICKFFPEKVLKIALEEWNAVERNDQPGSILSQIETLPDIWDFGLNDRIKYLYDFPSGYQTFYYWFFLYHPNKALDFLIHFLNESFESNKRARIANRRELKTVSLYFSSTVSTKQYFGTDEYWSLFRGPLSINELISSILMALEKGLLDLASHVNEDYSELRLLLKKLILETNNVAVLAVVASVIQAFPKLVDETSVNLLGVKEFFVWDSSRYSSELLTQSYYHRNSFLKRERIIENIRPHRRKYYLGLVGFVADYMFYYQAQNERLFKLVDQLWDSLDEKDDRMRKFLFDMDARKYKPRIPQVSPMEYVVEFVPGYDSYTEKMIAESRSDEFLFPSINITWVISVFDGEQVNDNNYTTWESKVKSALSSSNNSFLFDSFSGLAAIGLRDYFQIFTKKERRWCLDVIFNFGEKFLLPSEPYSIGSISSYDRPGLVGISLAFNTLKGKYELEKFKKLIFRLLISKMEEQSKIYFEFGITEYLYKQEPEFVLNCWHGMLQYILFENTDKGKKDLFGKNLVNSVANGKIKYLDTIDFENSRSLDFLFADALRIIPKNTYKEIQSEFIQKILKFHLDLFAEGDEYIKFEYRESREALKFFYARYVLDQPLDNAKKLFIELINYTYIHETNPQDLYKAKFAVELIEEFIVAISQGSTSSNFWVLWENLSEWMIENNRAYLIKIFLMDLDWDQSVDRLSILEGRNFFYRKFFLRYGQNQINSGIKFLSGIAFENFMPESISWIKTMLINHFLSNQDFRSINLNKLEDFVRKSFYRFGEEIKSQSQVLQDFLFILTSLVEQGSTVSYMLKEELIQYKNVQ